MPMVSRSIATVCVVLVGLFGPIGELGAQGPPVVRGRLQRAAAPNVWYPVSGVVVTVVRGDGVRSTPAFSGPDGMYYVYNLPAGAYIIELWQPYTQRPFATYPINVRYMSNQYGSWFDVPPIWVP